MGTKVLLLAFMVLFLLAPVQSAEKVEQTEEYLSKAIEFHGHLGPYLVLGLRAGLYANQILGKEPMETEAFIKSKTTPPESCFADGVQFSTGCTFGKGNISLEESQGLQVTFRKDNKKLILRLRKEIIEEMNSLPPQEEAWEKLAKDLYKREIKKIFEIL
ncbi:MAG: formylmethanofuran dehydrogenase subunit E family protein [Candidatus Aminicenantes bacterium]|nr:MAG: formylmethanofuran dehydrogenase subunit E family protein [Candidatus Aminicenantes bacterium]